MTEAGQGHLSLPDSGRSLTPEPCTLVIFGGSGDLARRKLVPALYNLFLDGTLPSNFAVLGIGRKSLSDEDFRAGTREGIIAYSRQRLADQPWAEFERHLFYLSGGIEDPQSYEAIKTRLEKIEAEHSLPGHRLFYLAIPPASYASACEGLQRAGLVRPPDHAGPFCRVIVEKPIGRDLESARLLLKGLTESLLYCDVCGHVLNAEESECTYCAN